MKQKMGTKKFIINIIVIHIIALFFFNQYASPPGPRQEKKKEGPSDLSYEVLVNVTKIDVIVTDKNGKRVPGLKPENFRISEDGVLQEMTNFYEVKGMDVYAAAPDKESGKLVVPPRPLPQKEAREENMIIIYFDNWHLHPMNRNWTVKKLESFIKNNFFPGSNNQGMVIALDQKLEIVQKFTPDALQLLQAIHQVKGRTGQALLRSKTKEDLKRDLNSIVGETARADKYTGYERAMGAAKSFVASEQSDLLYSLKSLNAIVEYMTGIEGRKILIHVSDGLPVNPGEEAFGFIDQAYPFGNARNEAMNYDATRTFKELTARCNANEITLYPINARGLETMTLSADKQIGWDSYRQGSGLIKPGSRLKNEGLKIMADDTGGVAILSTNNIEKGLERIEDDLQFHYTLAYRSSSREDNKYHSVKVKLTGIEGDFDVRMRSGYKHVSSEERIKESVFSRLFLKRLYNPMGFTVKFLPLKSKTFSSKLELTIKLLLPIGNLILRPQAGGYVGHIRVYVVLKDANGLISPCHELSEVIRIPARDYNVAVKSNYPYLVEMFVEPGDYTISLAVTDVFGSITGYYQAEKLISR